MEATAAHPTLLSAARNFIRKSAGSAVLVIAPLALAPLATPARAQITAVGFSPSGSIVSVSGGGSHYSGAFYFDTSLNGGAAHLVGGGVTFILGSGGSAVNGSIQMEGSGNGTLTGHLPVAYSFTLGTGVAASVSWSLDFSTGVAASQQLASGTGFGSFSGIGDYTLGTGFSFDYYEITLSVDFATSNGTGGMLGTIDMNQSANQGFAINASAIPEPASCGGWLGLAAGLVALVRRTFRRRATA